MIRIDSITKLHIVIYIIGLKVFFIKVKSRIFFLNELVYEVILQISLVKIIFSILLLTMLDIEVLGWRAFDAFKFYERLFEKLLLRMKTTFIFYIWAIKYDNSKVLKLKSWKLSSGIFIFNKSFFWGIWAEYLR